jgi:alkylation response protein AidB-like acyl-CoA dehydrogenase
MKLRLTKSQQEVVAQARAFARHEVLPLANRLDPQHAEIPKPLLERLAELGYFGITLPRQSGGLGLGVLEYCLVSEELAAAWMSVASVIGYTNGSTVALQCPRRDDYLRRMAAGRMLVAFALTEPEAGSDAAGLTCQAARDGDGWAISGRKRWCGYAKNADAILVYARTAPMPEHGRHRGISCFLVEKQRGRFPDGLVGRPIAKIGYFGITSWELDFEGLRLPPGALMGAEGEALAGGMQELTTARVQTAARAIGCARGAFDEARAHAARRQQFGRSLDRFQAIRFRLAEMATQIEAARSLTHAVAAQLDAGEPAIETASMAKLFASEMAEWVTSEAMQILGGNGYTTEHAVERHWRDARLTRIIEGTSEIQKHIIARSLLGSDGG